VSSIWS